MSLVKLSGDTTAITGKDGGQIWTRDASGQHVIARPQAISYARSEHQVSQQHWYTSRKYAERIGAEPTHPLIKPRSPPEVSIFGLNYMTAYKRWQLEEPYPLAKFYSDIMSPKVEELIKRFYEGIDIELLDVEPWAIEYIEEYHPNLPAQWGMPAWKVAALLSAYFGYHYYVGKETFDIARYKAIYVFDEGVISGALGWARDVFPITEPGIGPAMTLCIIALAAQVAIYCAVTAKSDPTPGTIRFNKRRVVIQEGDVAFLGSLAGRPSENMLDFVVVGSPAFISYSIDWNYQRPEEFYNTGLLPGNLITQVKRKIGYWNIYTWGEINTHWFKGAYKIATGFYRMTATQEALDYFDIPVGFYYPGEDYIDYNTKLDEYWRAWPEEGPKL